jgi:hypothetical protein
MDVPDDVDAATGGMLAEYVELLATESTNAQIAFDWDDGRPSRALWCGSRDLDAATLQGALLTVGKVAGLDIALADPARNDLLALGRSPQLLILASAFAGRGEETLAHTFEDRGGTVVVLPDITIASAIATGRVAIHDIIRRHIARTKSAPRPPRPPAITTPSPPREVRDTLHASDQARIRGFTRSELREALGDRSKRPEMASAAGSATHGKPIVIGTQQRGPGRTDDRDVLLGVTKAGRRLHIVVIRTDGSTPMRVITGWDPDATENRDNWRPDALRPTRQGELSLPPTSWIVAP